MVVSLTDTEDIPMRNVSFARTADRIAKNLDRLEVMDYSIAYKRLIARLEKNDWDTLHLREISSFLSRNNDENPEQKSFARKFAQKLKRA